MSAGAQRAVRRAVGHSLFDAWIAAYDATELADLYAGEGGNVYATAAAILESLADPSDERSLRVEGRGGIDTRGRASAYLLKAKKLRQRAMDGVGPVVQEVEIA